MALDLEIAPRIFDFIESSEGELDLLAEFPEFTADLVEAAERSGGAIFPDGFAVLGRDEDLSLDSRILVKPPGQAEAALVESGLEANGILAEGIRVIDARSYAAPDNELVEEKKTRLYLTREIELEFAQPIMLEIVDGLQLSIADERSADTAGSRTRKKTCRFFSVISPG